MHHVDQQNLTICEHPSASSPVTTWFDSWLKFSLQDSTPIILFMMLMSRANAKDSNMGHKHKLPGSQRTPKEVPSHTNAQEARSKATGRRHMILMSVLRPPFPSTKNSLLVCRTSLVRDRSTTAASQSLAHSFMVIDLLVLRQLVKQQEEKSHKTKVRDRIKHLVEIFSNYT